jgi:hypothetical protein
MRKTLQTVSSVIAFAGAVVAVGPGTTFPQPFVLTSPEDGACLWGHTDAYTKLIVVGFRR